MKRSIASEQTFALNVTDFERASGGRKVGYKFSIIFCNGRVDNKISSSPLAINLVALLLEDAPAKEILTQNDFQINFNSKFQINIKHLPKTNIEEEKPMNVTETEEKEVEK